MPWPSTAEATEELIKLSEQPVTEYSIGHIGPPACPICASPIGSCAHTGGVAAGDVLVEYAFGCW